MRTTEQLRKLWGPECLDWSESVVITVHSGAVIRCHPLCQEMFEAIDSVMAAFGYHPRREDTGCLYCRRITGGEDLSLHSFGIACDYSWRTNPYGRRLITDMPRPMVEAIEAIRTKGGHRVCRWGGDWNDNNIQDDRTFDAMLAVVVKEQGFSASLALIVA